MIHVSLKVLPYVDVHTKVCILQSITHYFPYMFATCIFKKEKKHHRAYLFQNDSCVTYMTHL